MGWRAVAGRLWREQAVTDRLRHGLICRCGVASMSGDVDAEEPVAILGVRPRAHMGRVARGRHVDPEALPEALRAAALAGVPANQRLVMDGLAMLAVALPLDPDGTAFVQLFPLIQLDRTLRYISVVLLAGAVASSLLAVGFRVLG
jgi:hypothetical protein